MIKVVLDTNVFISSFLGIGPPKQIIDCWRDGDVTLCLSQEIVDEYVLVLDRLNLGSEQEVVEILRLFSSGYHTLYAAKTPDLSIIENDRDDNKFLECALALNAQWVVSGDKHLLNLGKYMHIEIVSPRDFLTNAF